MFKRRLLARVTDGAPRGADGGGATTAAAVDTTPGVQNQATSHQLQRRRYHGYECGATKLSTLVPLLTLVL